MLAAASTFVRAQEDLSSVAPVSSSGPVVFDLSAAAADNAITIRCTSRGSGCSFLGGISVTFSSPLTYCRSSTAWVPAFPEEEFISVDDCVDNKCLAECSADCVCESASDGSTCPLVEGEFTGQLIAGGIPILPAECSSFNIVMDQHSAQDCPNYMQSAFLPTCRCGYIFCDGVFRACDIGSCSEDQTEVNCVLADALCLVANMAPIVDPSTTDPPSVQPDSSNSVSPTPLTTIDASDGGRPEPAAIEDFSDSYRKPYIATFLVGLLLWLIQY